MVPPKLKVVGIDLGTSFSAIAHINEDTNKAEIIPSPDQHRIIPSVVLIEDSQTLSLEKSPNRTPLPSQTRWLNSSRGKWESRRRQKGRAWQRRGAGVVF